MYFNSNLVFHLIFAMHAANVLFLMYFFNNSRYDFFKDVQTIAQATSIVSQNKDSDHRQNN